MYFHTLGQIHNLVWGGICAYLLFYYSKTKDFFSRLSNSRRILFYLIGILVFAFRNELVVVCGSITIKYILMVFYSFIIIDQSFSLSTKFKFPRNGKFVQYGKYTYSLYLIHPSVLVIFKNLFDFISSRGQLIQIFSYKTSILSAFLLFVITVVSSIYVATISYKYYESKFLRIKERFSVL